MTSVRHVATKFSILLSRGSATGYLALVQPPTFEEQCAEQRVLRDLELRAEALRGRRGPNHKTIVATERIHALHEQGLSIREIAAATGLSKETVWRLRPVVTKAESMRRKHVRWKAEGRVVLPPWIAKRAANG